MPTTESVEQRIKNVIVAQLGVEPAEVIPAANFVDDLGADSLDAIEVVMAFEEEFDLEIADEDAEKIQTVQQAIEFVKGNIKGSTASL